MTLGEFRRLTENLPDTTRLLKSHSYVYYDVIVNLADLACNKHFDYFYDNEDNLDDEDPTEQVVLIH